MYQLPLRCPQAGWRVRRGRGFDVCSELRVPRQKRYVRLRRGLLRPLCGRRASMSWSELRCTWGSPRRATVVPGDAGRGSDADVRGRVGVAMDDSGSGRLQLLLQRMKRVVKLRRLTLWQMMGAVLRTWAG